jgi:hypothetical protein
MTSQLDGREVFEKLDAFMFGMLQDAMDSARTQEYVENLLEDMWFDDGEYETVIEYINEAYDYEINKTTHEENS